MTQLAAMALLASLSAQAQDSVDYAAAYEARLPTALHAANKALDRVEGCENASFPDVEGHPVSITVTEHYAQCDLEILVTVDTFSFRFGTVDDLNGGSYRPTMHVKMYDSAVSDAGVSGLVVDRTYTRLDFSLGYTEEVAKRCYTNRPKGDRNACEESVESLSNPQDYCGEGTTLKFVVLSFGGNINLVGLDVKSKSMLYDGLQCLEEPRYLTDAEASLPFLRDDILLAEGKEVFISNTSQNADPPTATITSSYRIPVSLEDPKK